MEAVRWLEISTVVRRDLNVELAPVEIRKRIAKFGDFRRNPYSFITIVTIISLE
jgi:hypothetical protein